MHTTPVLHDGKLYTMFIHSKPAHIVCVDAKTGADVWKVVRPSDGRAECEHSYASPVLWHKGTETLLLVHGNDYCTAHRLNDGEEVWRLGGLNPKDGYDPTLRFVASPLATPDLIVVPTAKKGPVVAVKPSAKGTFSKGSEHELWRFGTTPDVPSPLLVGDLLFLCREKDQLICLDAKTGKVHFQERIHESRFRASPVYADGHVYLTARDGTVVVVKAEPKLTVVSKNKLPDITAASPALSGGRIYVHGYEYLYALGQAQ
jgi:outer membrane protein assembly factor BamB